MQYKRNKDYSDRQKGGVCVFPITYIVFIEHDDHFIELHGSEIIDELLGTLAAVCLHTVLCSIGGD